MSFILGVLFAHGLAAQANRQADLLEFADGAYLRGRFVRVSNDTIYFELPFGQVLAWPTTQVNRLVIQGHTMALADGRPNAVQPQVVFEQRHLSPLLPVQGVGGLFGSMALLPGLADSGTFSMGASMALGWMAYGQKGYGASVAFAMSRFDYIMPTFAGISCGLIVPLSSVRWQAGMDIGYAFPLNAMSTTSILDGRMRPLGSVWIGHVWHRPKDHLPIHLQLGWYVQRAVFSERSMAHFSIVQATFSRISLRLVAMWSWSMRRSKL